MPIPANVNVSIRDRTKVEGMSPEAYRNLEAAAKAAEAQGITLTIVAAKGGGHLSHSQGTEWDLTGHTADGKLWTPDQRVAVAQGARAAGADRFGLYMLDKGLGQGTLHLGQSGGAGRPAAVWGAGGRTSGPASRAFTNPAELAFLQGRPLPAANVASPGMVPPIPRLRPTAAQTAIAASGAMPQPFPNMRPIRDLPMQSVPLPPSPAAENIPFEGPMPPIPFEGPMPPVPFEGPMPPSLVAQRAPGFVDDLGGGMSPLRTYNVFEPNEIPTNKYGAEALAQAMVSGRSGAVADAASALYENVLRQNGVDPKANPFVMGAQMLANKAALEAAKAEIENYFTKVLPTQAPGAVREVQRLFSGDPKYRELIPKDQLPFFEKAFAALPPQATGQVAMPNLRGDRQPPSSLPPPLVASNASAAPQMAAFTPPAATSGLDALGRRIAPLPPVSNTELVNGAFPNLDVARDLYMRNAYEAGDLADARARMNDEAPAAPPPLMPSGPATTGTPFRPGSTSVLSNALGLSGAPSLTGGTPATYGPTGFPTSQGALPSPSLYDGESSGAETSFDPPQPSYTPWPAPTQNMARTVNYPTTPGSGFGNIAAPPPPVTPQVRPSVSAATQALYGYGGLPASGIGGATPPSYSALAGQQSLMGVYGPGGAFGPPPTATTAMAPPMPNMRPMMPPLPNLRPTIPPLPNLSPQVKPAGVPMPNMRPAMPGQPSPVMPITDLISMAAVPPQSQYPAGVTPLGGNMVHVEPSVTGAAQAAQMFADYYEDPVYEKPEEMTDWSGGWGYSEDQWLPDLDAISGHGW